MSEEQEIRNKLSLVIRRVQEGKTTICIKKIISEPTRVHIILTMNTLSASAQFFDRLKTEVRSEHILVMNSNPSSAGTCYHAKDVTAAIKLLRAKPIKVIVCCAHEKRFRDSIPSLLSECADSMTLRVMQFMLHIDEAHAYIRSYREEVRHFNEMENVVHIYGYTGSPDPIFDPTEQDPLYTRIEVYDPEMMCSEFYFGAKNMIQKTFEHIEPSQFVSDAQIPDDIPDIVLRRSDMGDTSRKTWYNERSKLFQLGNEHLFLSFTDFILRTELVPAFRQDTFSYHFIPSYKRKVTQYFLVDMFMKYFPNANVIVMNGNGMEMYRLVDGTSFHVRKIVNGFLVVSDKKDTSKPRLLEPSNQIQALIEGFSQAPTFVTGLDCVGMSVTLINQHIGNFDSVVFGHDQLNREQRYQLCRFSFNYARWTNKVKVKPTQWFSLTKSVVDTCLEYEQEVETICRDFQGTAATIREIHGLEAYVPDENKVRKKELKTLSDFLENPDQREQWKRFPVMDDNEEEQWNKARTYYEQVRGKELKGKAMPKKIDGFYNCSTTSSTKNGCQFRTRSEIEHIRLGQYAWSSLFQLRQGQLNYARVFIGYTNNSDPSEYTIYIKHAELRDCEQVHSLLEKYYPKKRKVSGAAEVQDSDTESDATSEVFDEV